jgi:hypothetical protein
MTATFLRADDPRSPLQKATRYELIAYARANGVADAIVAAWHRQIDNIPADILRDELRSRGLTRPPMRPRTLGLPNGNTAPSDIAAASSGPEIDAIADLKRQFLSQPAAPAPAPPRPVPVQSSIDPAPAAPTTPLAHMSILELGREMKRLNIKRDRRDNMIIMRQKIEAHGQDAAQRRE